MVYTGNWDLDKASANVSNKNIVIFSFKSSVRLNLHETLKKNIFKYFESDTHKEREVGEWSLALFVWGERAAAYCTIHQRIKYSFH